MTYELNQQKDHANIYQNSNAPSDAFGGILATNQKMAQLNIVDISNDECRFWENFVFREGKTVDSQPRIFFANLR